MSASVRQANFRRASEKNHTDSRFALVFPFWFDIMSWLMRVRPSPVFDVPHLGRHILEPSAVSPSVVALIAR